MYQVTTLSPSRIAWPRSSVSRVAVRRKCRTGRRPSQDLVDRGPDQRRVVLQHPHLIGVLHEREQPVADRVPRRLVAGDHQQAEVVVELALGQDPLALRDGERGDRVVLWLLEPEVALPVRRTRTSRARWGAEREVAVLLRVDLVDDRIA